MAGANIFNLKNVDYSERGQTLEIIVDGVPKPQTIIFFRNGLFRRQVLFYRAGVALYPGFETDKTVAKRHLALSQ